MTYSNSGIASRPAHEPPTILAVENDPVLGDRLKNILETAGYPCEIARDGQEALSIIHQRLTPHLIISDFQMPEMYGLQLLQTIQGNPKTRGMPFILVTGNSSFFLRKQAFRDGAFAILYKPYSPRELLHILNRAISIQTKSSVVSENPVLGAYRP